MRSRIIKNTMTERRFAKFTVHQKPYRLGGKQPFILFIIVKETKLPLGRIFIKRINKKLFGQRQGLKISTQQGQLQFVYHIRRLVEQIDFQFVKLV